MRVSVYVLGALAAIFVVGCGSSSSSSTTVKPSGLSKRVLISNQSQNALSMLNASKDTLFRTISASGPGKMVHSGNFTAILSASPELQVFDGTTEQISQTILLQDVPSDVILSQDGGIGWVAERNSSIVQVASTLNGTVAASIPIPDANKLVMGPNFTRFLAFSDDPQHALSNPNAFFVVDAKSNVVTPITLAPGDQPINGVFNASESVVFIMNCGTECGGTAAPSVVRVDLTNLASPQISAHIPVTAATVGLINSSTLYVAGTAVGAPTGTLQAIDTNSLAVAPGITNLPNGFQSLMALTPNQRLFIGSTGCTPGAPDANNRVTGCLAIADISAATPPAGGFPVTIPSEPRFRQNFDVTGLQPISGRTVVYVVQGGEIDFFDSATSAVSSTITPVDIPGLAFGVVQIDP
jgi:hypothetical protein